MIKDSQSISISFFFQGDVVQYYFKRLVAVFLIERILILLVLAVKKVLRAPIFFFTSVTVKRRDIRKKSTK